MRDMHRCKLKRLKDDRSVLRSHAKWKVTLAWLFDLKIKKLVFKAVTIALLFSFTIDSLCYGLATLPASQNPLIKREIEAALHRTQIRYAESEDAKRLLEANNASCLLLSSGKYLVTKEVAEDDLRLLRAIIHEDIEAVMQIIAKEDRNRHQAIKELILKYLPPVRDNLIKYYPMSDYDNFSKDLYVNHIVAKAFEWLLPLQEGFIREDEIPQEDAAFIAAIKPIIMANRHSYFTSEFWDSDRKRERIRISINKGMVFYQTASLAGKTLSGVANKNSEYLKSIGEYVIDNYKIINGQSRNPVGRKDIEDALSIEGFDKVLSAVDYKENFTESFGDLIILLLRQRGGEGINILKDMVRKMISEIQKAPAGRAGPVVEFVGQLQMLCYETYSATDFSGPDLMCRLIDKFNANSSMEVITKVCRIRRMLEYLQKEDEIEGLGQTVGSVRDMIDNLGAGLFRSGWSEKAMPLITVMVKNSLNAGLKVTCIKDEDLSGQILKVHKSQRDILWGGQSHAETTMEKKRRGATVYSGIMTVDGKEKIVCLQIRVKNFIRTAAVLDIMHRMGAVAKLRSNTMEGVIKEGYPYAYWRVLDNNGPSNAAAAKWRNSILGRGQIDGNYAQEIQRLTAEAQLVFGEAAGVYCDMTPPEALDYGDPRPSYKYTIDFLTPKDREKYVKKHGFKGNEMGLAVDIFNHIGKRGLDCVKQFLGSVNKNDRFEALRLSRDIVVMLEKENAWVYAPSYYDFIFGSNRQGGHATFLAGVKDFLEKEEGKSALACSTEDILKRLVDFHPEKTQRDSLTGEELAAHERCANYIRDRLRKAGLKIFETVSPVTGEKSVIGIIGDVENPGGRTRIFDCHYDVRAVVGRKEKEHYRTSVGFASDIIREHDAEGIFNRNSGEIARLCLGAGIYDMLGSGAALLAAIESVKERVGSDNSCIFVFAPDEELGGHHGTEVAVNDLFKQYPGLCKKAEGGKAEVAILEPTDLAVNTYYRGQVVVAVDFAAPPHNQTSAEYVDFKAPYIHSAYFDKNSATGPPVLKQVIDFIEAHPKLFPTDLAVGDLKEGQVVASGSNDIPTYARLYYSKDKADQSQGMRNLIEFIRKYWAYVFKAPSSFPASKFGTNGVSYGINFSCEENVWKAFLNIRMFYDDKNIVDSKIRELVGNLGNITKISFVEPIYKKGRNRLADSIKSHAAKHWPKVQGLYTENYEKATGNPEFFGGTVARFYKKKGIDDIAIFGPAGFLPHAFGEAVFSGSLEYMALTLEDLIKEQLSPAGHTPDAARKNYPSLRRGPIKVLLVDLPSPRHEINEALGVEVVAGHLRKYYGSSAEVEIVDMQFGHTVRDILEKIRKEPPDILGLSVKIGSYPPAKEMLDSIFSERFRPEERPLVVLGNTVATFAHRKLLERYKDVFISVGEGEEALLGITALLNEKVQPEDRANIGRIKEILINEDIAPNIAMNLGGKVVHTKRKPVDLNKAVTPYRSTIDGVVAKGGIVTIEGSRGCPWGRCAFCAVKHRFKKWRPFPIGKIMGELEDLSKRGVRNVYFVDEDFVGPKIGRAKEIAREIMKAKEDGRIDPQLRFSISTRVKVVFWKEKKNEERKELFRLLKEAGLHIVFLGIESGSDTQLERFNKDNGVTAEHNKKAVAILNELGVIVEPGFIMFDPGVELRELEENIAFLEVIGLANTTSKVTGELHVQAGSDFVDILGCLEDNLDLNSLSYPYPSDFKDEAVGNIYKALVEWEDQAKHVVYYLQGITRGNALEKARYAAEESLIKMRRSSFDFLKSCVKIKGDLSKIDDVRTCEARRRTVILDGILRSINSGELPAPDAFIKEEIVRLATLGRYDTGPAAILLSDLIYAHLHEDRIYEVKYDASRLTASQIEIVEEYVRLLQARCSDPNNIKLRPFSSSQGSKESLIAVYCTGKDFKGEGHVDVSIPEGEISEYLLRITGMINIALASSNIPEDLTNEEIDKYRPIMSYIKNQYKSILGEELALPDSLKDIVKVIRRIVIGLPKALRMKIDQIEEYNRLAKKALTNA